MAQMSRIERLSVSVFCGMCLVAPLTVLGVLMFTGDGLTSQKNGISISHKLTYGMKIRYRHTKPKLAVATRNSGKAVIVADLNKIPIVRTEPKPRTDTSKIHVSKRKDVNTIMTAEQREEEFLAEMERRRQK